MFSSAFVCLLAGFHKNYLTDFHRISLYIGNGSKFYILMVTLDHFTLG